jgi:hypothetical protein
MSEMDFVLVSLSAFLNEKSGIKKGDFSPSS